MKQYHVPTIPSRFLTPVLKFENSEAGVIDNGDRTQDSILISTVARLIDDGSQLGPGQYNMQESKKMSPRGTIKWSHSKTARTDFFTKKNTPNEVGPGKYQLTKKIHDRSIKNPTIPRADNNNKTQTSFNKKLRNTMRVNDFEEDDDDSNYVSPGPGQYLQAF